MAETTGIPRANIVDLFSQGERTCRNANFQSIHQQLKWRQKYLKCDYYELALESGETLVVKQILNGELKGLGTGTQVWPAAHVMVKYLEKRFRATCELSGKRICDIGTGTGITGFAAANMGAVVTLTDQQQLLPFLDDIKLSVCSAGVADPSHISIMRYDWGENAADLPQPFDYVLVSDCVLPKLYPIDILVQAVSDVMGPGTVALFSYEHRTYPDYDPRLEFRRLAALKGLEVREVPLSQHDPRFSAPDIEIWEVDIVMKNYGKISCLGQIEESDSPQFITGRIMPVTNFLTAPISGKPCVYYEVRVEQLAERTDENGLAGDVEDGKVWEFRCGETLSSDFVLFDPAFPSVELYIPGTQVAIKVHATEEIRAGRSKVYKQTKLPDHTRSFLKKHKCENLEANGKVDKNVRFREANFEFSEQIAVLGIVRLVTDERGEQRRVLCPVHREVFTEEFCQSKGWSDWDRRSWRDLTKEPSIILTDMPDYFQNVNVGAIPAKMTRKPIAPVTLSTVKPGPVQTRASVEAGPAVTAAAAQAASAASADKGGPAAEPMER